MHHDAVAAGRERGMGRWVVSAVVVVGLGGVLATAWIPRVSAATFDARAAAARSLALVQRGAARYVKSQDCFSCHHQALPLMTFALAGRKGLAVEAAAVSQQ